MTPARFDILLERVIELAAKVDDSRDKVALAVVLEGHSRNVKRMTRRLYSAKHELRGLCFQLGIEATPTESQENFIRRMRGVEPR